MAEPLVAMTPEDWAALEAAEAAAARSEAEAAKANPDWLLTSGKLTILSKAEKLVPLALNHAQKIVLGKIQEIERQGKPVRLLILKARQEGVSTLLAGLFFARTSQAENRRALIVADSDDNASGLFEKIKLMHAELEQRAPHLAPAKKKSNAKALEFDQIGSRLGIASAQSSAGSTGDGAKRGGRIGRSKTLSMVHLSEVAFFPSLAALLVSLVQSVPNLPGTIIVQETTANGLGGPFHELWTRAVAGQNGWEPIFLPWFLMPEYTMPLGPGESLEPLSAEERALRDAHGLCLEQIKWRRWCINDNFNGDVEAFRQEYPATAEEAFITGGTPVFDAAALRQYLLNAPEPIAVGRLVGNDAPELEPDAAGELSVWRRPEPGHRYVITADVAEGLDGAADYSTASVWDMATDDQAAEWHGKTPPDLFAAALARLGLYYFGALVACEANNHGLTTIKFLQEGHPSQGTAPYHAIYYRREIDKAADRETNRPGWLTTTATRPLMLGKLRLLVRDRALGIKSRGMAGEMLSFVRHVDGKWAAAGGGHDDRVISAAIYAQVRGEVSPADHAPAAGCYAVVEVG